MKESNSWLNVMSEFSQQLVSLKEGVIGADTIIKKLDLLLAEHNNLDDKSQLELKYSIFSANLPGELTKQLLNKVEEQKAKIIQQGSPSPTPYQENSSNEHSGGHHQTQSSSLLQDLMQWDEHQQSKPIKPGQIIRSTYCLDCKIGSGGMGEVWKAIDLIQDAGEAKDKYVAIKFINHEIRSHPYALKALIREFARYKKLIHPNIVKAYELNRDENEIFIAMEYLEGESLKEFISQHPEGVPLKQAQTIIKGMCDALEYSHNEGIVHLDIKPGNIFYNHATQACKVIDFGIARLSSLEDRDKTRFDPGSLGAMTTAYASSEMLMGAEPDPTDDVYGLACVIYELLSGQHPFNKNLSLKAERENLQPKQIPGLGKDSFQALIHGLSFHRDTRTASAKELYSELYLSKKRTGSNHARKLIIGSMTVLAMLVIPFISYKGYKHWQQQQVSTAIQQQIYSGMEGFISLSVDEQKELLKDPSLRLALVEYAATQNDSANDALSLLEQFDPKIQQILFTTRKVRAYLITFYSNEINQAIKEDNFQLAEQLVLRILEQYPDSMRLIKQSQSIKPLKAKRLATFQQRYQSCLEDTSKNLTELFPCLQQTRTVLSNIDNTIDLSNSPRLTKRYSVEISSAISINNLPLAETLLANWHTLEKSEISQRTQLEQQLAYANKIDELIRQYNDSSQTELAKNQENPNDQLKVLQELKKKLALSAQQQSLLTGAQPLKKQSVSGTAGLTELLSRAEQQLTKGQLIKPVGDNAWQTYQDILSLDPDNQQALVGIDKITKTYILWARAESKKGNIEQAKHLFNNALEVSPDNQAALSGLALLEKQQTASQQLPPTLEVPIVKQPDPSSSDIAELLNRAEGLIAQKQLMTPVDNSAWSTYQKILSLDPGNKQALAGIDKITKTYILWARVEAKKGNVEQAKYLFNKALKVSPADKDALSGLTMLDQNNPASEQQTSTENEAPLAQHPVPSSPQLTELLKKVERQLARKQLMTPVKNSAWQTYQDILSLDPGNKQALAGINKITRTFVLWAREETKNGDIQQAKYHFNKALEASPGNKDALSGLAMLDQNHPESQQQPSPASQEPVEKQPELNTPEINDLLNRAEQQLATNQIMKPVGDNAWQTYQDILSLDPGNQKAQAGIEKITKIYVLRAWEEIENKNYKQAASLFNKALEASPGDKDALKGLLWLKEI